MNVLFNLQHHTYEELNIMFIHNVLSPINVVLSAAHVVTYANVYVRIRNGAPPHPGLNKVQIDV